jgi:hypothetical protein
MARKNGRTTGAFNPIFVGLAFLAALVMVVVDARGRPVLASVAYSLTVFVTVSTTLARCRRSRCHCRLPLRQRWRLS